MSGKSADGTKNRVEMVTQISESQETCAWNNNLARYAILSHCGVAILFVSIPLGLILAWWQAGLWTIE